MSNALAGKQIYDPKFWQTRYLKASKNISVFSLVPSMKELNELETKVAHILGWQAGVREVREVIREYRWGRRPVHRYDRQTIDRLTEVISPTQNIQAKAFKGFRNDPFPRRMRFTTRVPRIGGK